VPTLQLTARHVHHYARSKTWIAGSDSSEERTFEPQYMPQEQRELFEKNPQEYLKFRKELEGRAWRGFTAFLRGSEENTEARERFIELMRTRLVKKPGLLQSLIPDFSPNCRRLTPGPGYLEALTEPNVDLIQIPIKRFTKIGIETIDGEHRQVDAIFCATGANVDAAPPSRSDQAAWT
jgi:Predicted flavoprotein involved in K+ transport